MGQGGGDRGKKISKKKKGEKKIYISGTICETVLGGEEQWGVEPINVRVMGGLKRWNFDSNQRKKTVKGTGEKSRRAKSQRGGEQVNVEKIK